MMDFSSYPRVYAHRLFKLWQKTKTQSAAVEEHSERLVYQRFCEHYRTQLVFWRMSNYMEEADDGADYELVELRHKGSSLKRSL